MKFFSHLIQRSPPFNTHTVPAGCDALCLAREGGSGQHSHSPLALSALALWMVEKVRKRAKSSVLLVVVRSLSHTRTHARTFHYGLSQDSEYFIAQFPVLFIDSVYTSLYLLIPNSHSVPLPPSFPLATTSLFSVIIYSAMKIMK